MAYVSVPKDITKVEAKVLFGLTKRQLCYFSTAILVGAVVFFLSYSFGQNIATILTCLSSFPMMFAAFYKRDGLTGEKYFFQYLLVRWIRPHQRVYRNENIYTDLEWVLTYAQKYDEDHKKEN